MNEYIKKVEEYKKKTLGKALEKLKPEYERAKEFYTDTGYDRYFKKMNKCEEQIEEIEKYLRNGQEENKSLTPDDYKELISLQQAMKNIKSKILYISKDLPITADLISLQELLKDF